MTEQEKTSAVVEETREAGGYRYCSGGGRRFVWLG